MKSGSTSYCSYKEHWYKDSAGKKSLKITLKHNDYDYNGNKRSTLPHYQCYHFNPASLLIQPTNLTVSSFFRSSQASFSWYSLFYQSNEFLVEVISKTVSY